MALIIASDHWRLIVAALLTVSRHRRESTLGHAQSSNSKKMRMKYAWPERYPGHAFNYVERRAAII